MSCLQKPLSVEQYPALKDINSYCGTNITQYMNYICKVIHPIDSIGNVDFTDEFKKAIGNSIKLDLKAGDISSALKDAIIKYVTESYSSTSATNRVDKKEDKVLKFGYPNAEARKEAVDTFAEFMIAGFHNDVNILHVNKEINKSDYVNFAMHYFTRILAKRLSKVLGESWELLFDILRRPEGLAYVNKKLKRVNLNLNAQTLLALYKEFSTVDIYTATGTKNETGIPVVNPKEEFLKEVFQNSQLNAINFNKNETIEDVLERTQYSEDEAASSNREIEAITELEFDTTIGDLNNKHGLYLDFLTHVDIKIQTLLSSLYKCKPLTESNNVAAYDVNNYLGLPRTMNANNCCSILYHYGEYDTIGTMMNSIKKIYQTMPGYEAFKMLHDFLNDPKNIDLKWKFYTTFKKLTIYKTATVVSNGEAKLYIRNKNLNKTEQLNVKFLNAFKSSALNSSLQFNKKNFLLLEQNIKAYDLKNDPNGKNVRAVADLITNEYKKWFPFINEFHIRNFILMNKSANNEIESREANVQSLLGRLGELINHAGVAFQNYQNKQAKIAAVARRNARLKDKTKKEDLTAIYAEPYFPSAVQGWCGTMAKLFENYIPISTPLNSPNIEGHQSSNVINENMCTHIAKVLQSSLNISKVNSDGSVEWAQNSPLMNLAKHRSQTHQFDFGNILLEHTDEQGRVINKGIFRKNEKGEWVPTEDANKLIEVTLYEGAANQDSEDNVTYSKMSHNDYLRSAWENFFNNENEDKAGYFVRIPSDAPNIYIIRAPKYSANNLLRESNLNEIKTECKVFMENLIKQKITPDQLKFAYFNDNPIKVSDTSKVYNNTKEFVKHLNSTSSNPVSVILPESAKRILSRNKKEDVLTVLFRYVLPDSEKTDNIYAMQGRYEKGKLVDAHFVGFHSESNIDPAIIPAYTKAVVENKRKLAPDNGGVRWNVNINDPLYKQIENLFMQELSDMLVAGNVMFKTIKVNKNTGEPIKENEIVPESDIINYFTLDSKGNPLMKNGWSNKNQNGLHPTYHFQEGDNQDERKIYTKENGKIKLLGQVFHSNKFILYDENTVENGSGVRNYGEEILNKLFSSFFYGGANANSLAFTESNGVYTPIISNEQRAFIQQNLSEFIVDFVEEARDEIGNIFKTEGITEFDSIKLAEFTINSFVMYNAFDDLFEGNSKFYKNAQTFLKRAKEIQGSGVGYAMADITRDISSVHGELDSPLDTVTFFGDHKVKMYDSFRATTIYNSIKTEHRMLDCLVNTLTDKKYMGDSVLTKDEAETLLYGPKGKDGKRDGGYQNTTINDAQSYITFDEWIRRITGRGQLTQYKPLIDKILDENTPLTGEEIKDLFVQVQKNFYYDMYYNKTTQTISPRQIKNAEFVLIPRFIRGTELEQIAKIMDKLGIDQLNTVETSKSGQGSRFTIWNDDGELTDEIREDLTHIDEIDKKYTAKELKQMAEEGKTPYKAKSEIFKKSNRKKVTELYNYTYLYTQSETPQHLGQDAENKAGIQFMKKIVDNIDQNSPKELRDAKDAFHKLYSANIEDGYKHLLSRMGIDGKNNLEKDEDGNIKGLDKQKLYDLLLEELSRLGLDSNTMAYCELGEDGEPLMPNSTSMFGFKFENIVQSIFNRNITRQTLPGFHAAQVSGVGFQSFREAGVEKGKVNGNLRYHYEVNEENGEYVFREYAEIMLSYSALGIDRYNDHYRDMTDEEILAELAEKGLDKIIGYRIPTEGKQSVAYMKVVKLLDDKQGSTIIVPDAWVSQTGADFDIDSVYGIQYKTYIDNSGEIRKIEYKEKFTEKDWRRYIAKQTGDTFRSLSKEIIDFYNAIAKAETKEEKKELFNQAYQEQAAETAKVQDIEERAFNNLSKRLKIFIMKNHKDSALANKDANARDKYLAQLYNENAAINTALEEVKNLTDKEKEDLITYRDIKKQILDSVLEGPSKVEVDFDYNAVKSKKVKSLVEEWQLAEHERVSKLAADNNLPSYDEYISERSTEDGIIKNNTKDARTNKLIEHITTMLTHNASLEENLSRSNFDKISDALKKYNSTNKVTNAKRKARTPYNIFSQAWYQEDAMSGLKLKGISVVRDTLCSVMNNIRPILSDNASIKVKYAKNKYKLKELKKHFDNVDEKSDDDYYIVTHNTFGWSKDNKNIENAILTSYSSQTSAHTFDAMKAGNVPNVNELTFQVYKTIVDVGSDYETAISFIMQPGVARIVEAFNNTNSIYSKEKSKRYVKQAVKQIADELGIDYEWNTKIEDILTNIDNKYRDVVAKLFGYNYMFTTAEDINKELPLDKDIQEQRIAESGIFEGDNSSPVKGMYAYEFDDDTSLTVGELKALYDLSVILQYNKISYLVNDIKSIAMVSNPDKFGAKQTIFATRQVLDNLINILNNSELDGVTPRILKDGKHVLHSLYPGINLEAESIAEICQSILNNEKFVNDSSYPFLAAFLKYSTVPSIIINSTLFDTQKESFINFIIDPYYGLNSTISGNLTEDLVKDFQKYVISYLINKSRFLQTPLKPILRKSTHLGFDISKGTSETNEEERKRVIGYNYPAQIGYVTTVTDENGVTEKKTMAFKVNDIHNPSKDEVNEFLKLTPAQKVFFIQQNFVAGAPLFDYIDVNLYNESAIKRGTGYQTLSFNENGANIENVYREFELAFTNKNPLVAIATADLIKYAFFVEGYRVGMGNISKLIKNSILYNEDKLSGTGIISDFKETISNLNIELAEYGDMLIENYVRGHFKEMGIPYRRVSYFKQQKAFEINRFDGKLIVLNENVEDEKNILIKYGISDVANDGIANNKYIRLQFGFEPEVLYYHDVRNVEGNVYHCLIPLNPLMKTENKTWSSIDHAYEVSEKDYYIDRLDNYFNSLIEAKANTAMFDANNYLITNKDIKAEDYANPDKKIDNEASIPIKDFEKEFPETADKIRTWYSNSVTNSQPELYVFDLGLKKYIRSFGTNGESIQSVTLPNGSKLIVRIEKVNIGNYVTQFTGNEKNLNREGGRTEKQLVSLIQSIAKNTNDKTLAKSFGDIYKVTPANIDVTDTVEEETDEMFSDLLDVAINYGQTISNVSRNESDNLDAKNIAREFEDKKIIFDRKHIGENTDTVIIAASKLIFDTVTNLINKYKNYIPKEDGNGFYAINSPEAFNIIKKNPVLRRQFVKDILERDKILKQYGIINTFDITSEDSSLRKYLEDIVKSLNDIQNISLLSDAEDLVMKEYYDKMSLDPRIKNKLMSSTDGYHRTNTLMAWLHDIQEASNPIVQLILKDFQIDYRAKLMQAQKDAEDFEKFVDDLKEKARKAGKSVNIDNIIDEYGKFKQEFTDQFLKDRDELQSRVNTAIVAHGRGSVQHLKALLAYDEWKEKHLEQPLVNKYYHLKNKFLREILYGKEVTDPQTGKTKIIGKAPELLSYYKQIQYKKFNEQDKLRPNIDNPDLLDLINEYTGILREIRSPYKSINGIMVDKNDDNSFDYEHATPEERLAWAKDNKTQTNILNEYLNKIQDLNNEFFTYTASEDFYTQLEENKKIVLEYENSGNPPASYVDNPRYRKAKSWIKRNTRKNYIFHNKEDREAYEELKETYTVSTRGELKKLKEVLRDKAYRDSFGEFDPSLIPDEVIDKLRQEEIDANRYYGSLFSDRTLIKNANNEDEIYTETFYNLITPSTGSIEKDRFLNPRWQKTVTDLNDLLAECYDSESKTIDFFKIQNTKEGKEKLDKILKLYEELASIRKYTIKFGKNKVADEILDKDAINKDQYEKDLIRAKAGKDAYHKAILRIINLVTDDVARPNPFLYGVTRPKEKYREEYLDKKKTKAAKNYRRFYKTVNRPEFERKRIQMQLNSSPEEYAKWYAKNTIYNPNTHTVEPIRVWRERTVLADEVEETPTFENLKQDIRQGKFTQREIDEEVYFLPDEVETTEDYVKSFDFVNPNYKKDVGHAGNYKQSSDGKYKTGVQLNEFEKELKERIKTILYSRALTQKDINYINRGYLPSRARKDANKKDKIWKRVLHDLGFNNEHLDYNGWKEDISYATDRDQATPMLSLLRKNRDEVIPRPVKKEDETEQQYEARLQEWMDKIKASRATNLKEHKELLDTDYLDVMKDFIIKSGIHRAIQQNKYQLYFGLNMLQKYGSYIARYNKKGEQIYKKSYDDGVDGEYSYKRQIDEKLIGQFQNQLRRIIFNQYKEVQNPRMLRIMRNLQNITSAQYMMMNIKGGIANATFGGFSMIQEVMAKEVVAPKDLRHGSSFYASGMVDYAQAEITGKTNTLAGGLVELMDVVDYDQHIGAPSNDKSYNAYVRKFKSFMYTPQTAGEHEMQNRMMFALMYSHRLFVEEDRENLGKPKYVFKNYQEYIRDNREKALKSILTEEELKEYNEMLDRLRKDANLNKEFMHFQDDVISVFAREKLDNSRKKLLAKELDKLNKDAKKTFEDDVNHPTIMSQFKLNDDKSIGYKEGSYFESLSKIVNEDGINQATQLLAEFKGRVISVNKYIHGVYDKSGKAQLERKLLGSLIMQYHKHLPMGIMRRYRSQGYFNEERGTVNKGMYRSLYDFLAIPFKKHQKVLGLTDEEVDTLNAIKQNLRSVVDFAFKGQFITEYKLLPEYEKANIRRFATSLGEVLGLIFAVIAIKAGWDDDDSLLYNMALYQSDRLATETSQYFPFMAWGEARKLWQSPIAAGSGITDLLSSANMIAHMILDGDEYDGEYHSGKFAGEDKLWVYVQRRIPIWRGIKSTFFDVQDNNSYYKVSENMLGFIDVDQRAEDFKKIFH